LTARFFDIIDPELTATPGTGAIGGIGSNTGGAADFPDLDGRFEGLASMLKRLVTA
jgi:hypothetical protein